MLETHHYIGFCVTTATSVGKPRKSTQMVRSLILSFVPFSFQVGLQWPFPRILFPSVSGALQSLLWAVWIFSQRHLHCTDQPHVCLCWKSPGMVRTFHAELSNCFRAIKKMEKQNKSCHFRLEYIQILLILGRGGINVNTRAGSEKAVVMKYDY